MNPTRVKPQCAYSWHPVGDSHQKLGEVGSSAQVRVTVCSLHCCMKGDTGVCDPSSRKAWVHTTEAADGLTFMHALFNTFLHSLNKHLLRRHRWRKPWGGGAGRISGPQSTLPGDGVLGLKQHSVTARRMDSTPKTQDWEPALTTCRLSTLASYLTSPGLSFLVYKI